MAIDRRVRRTRATLQAALLELMVNQDYAAITVQDIIDRANVGRSTFYNHYTGKDDLLHDGLAELRSIVEQPTPVGDPPVRALSLPLLRHIHQHQRLARAIFARSAPTPVLRAVEQLLVDAVQAELPGTAYGRIPPAATARFMVGAFIGMLQWWLSAEVPAPPEEVNRMFRTLVTPSLRAATA